MESSEEEAGGSSFPGAAQGSLRLLLERPSGLVGTLGRKQRPGFHVDLRLPYFNRRSSRPGARPVLPQTSEGGRTYWHEEGGGRGLGPLVWPCLKAPLVEDLDSWVCGVPHAGHPTHKEDATPALERFKYAVPGGVK